MSAKLIAELEAIGQMGIADRVRTRTLPGQTVASLDEIAAYAEGGELSRASILIRDQIAAEAREVAEQDAADVTDAREAAIAVIGEDRVPGDVLRDLIRSYGMSADNPDAGVRKVRAADLTEGTEVIGVGVMEADAEPLGSTHVRLYIEGRVYDKPADSLVTIG